MSPYLKPRISFLQKMGMGITCELTRREEEVILLMHKGYAASKIASEIKLSKRTVEHHVERIKEKLECYSKAELIQKTLELRELGYFGI